ncbi:MAG: hypothetical protein QW548_00940 [Candidatus Aenigmatarchaeota archaeon]
MERKENSHPWPMGRVELHKNKDVAIKLLQQADVSWNTNLTNLYQPEASIRKKAEKKPNLHEEMKQKLLEIGVWQGYIAEPERKLDGERVDVAWVRSQVKGAVPKVVFEVQVSGSPKSALGNLKDAYDKWNSIPVIVVTESMRESVERLLYGMYHEILPEIKILTIDDVRKLHEGEKKVYEIKTKRTLGKVLDAI